MTRASLPLTRPAPARQPLTPVARVGALARRIWETPARRRDAAGTTWVSLPYAAAYIAAACTAGAIGLRIAVLIVTGDLS